MQSLVSGWHLQPGKTYRRERTEEYRGIVNRAVAGNRDLPEDAKAYRYLFVGGLLTENYGAAYMKTNLERCVQLGLDAIKISIDTDASVATNAQTVREAILREAPRKVVLLGHSKGGVDVAAALAQFPELHEHVRAFVAMQTPYGGTYVAGTITSTTALRVIAEKLIQGILKGDMKCMHDLTYESRASYLAAHPLDTERIPTLCFASTSSEGMMAPLSKYLQSKHGVRSDGMVPEFDAIIPGADLVRSEGVDHGGTVMLMGSNDRDQPADITQALLILALRVASERDAVLAVAAAAKAVDADNDDKDDSKKKKKDDKKDKKADADEDDKAKKKDKKDKK